MQTNFLGKNGITWWIGIISNRVDPLGLGRCQVRIFGFHGDFTGPDGLIDESSPAVTNIPTEKLPWAYAIYPLNTANTFQTPPLGAWVSGFFLDGESAQQPIMWGVIPGYNQYPQNTDDVPATALAKEAPITTQQETTPGATTDTPTNDTSTVPTVTEA